MRVIRAIARSLVDISGSAIGAGSGNSFYFF